MANLSKIKVGDTTYNIVPKLGTALKEEDGTICLSIGSGIAFNDEKKLVLNFGSGLVVNDTSKKVVTSIGTAKVQGSATDVDTGIAIRDGEFYISPVAFKSYLQSLGVLFI